AFRGVDWSTQGMTDVGQGRYGTESEWRRVAARVAAIPESLSRARANLDAGVRAGNTPDWRMVARDGPTSSEANAVYSAHRPPPAAAARRTHGQPFAAAVTADLKTRGAAAARAFRDFKRFLENGLARGPHVDRYAFGAAEYDWALKNNLHVEETAAGLYESS